MRKPAFCICENKDADQLSAFVFATRIVQSLFFLNPKLQVSSHLLWLYSPVCVGPGGKPRRPVFSQQSSNMYTPVHVIWLFCLLYISYLAIHAQPSLINFKFSFSNTKTIAVITLNFKLIICSTSVQYLFFYVSDSVPAWVDSSDVLHGSDPGCGTRCSYSVPHLLYTQEEGSLTFKCKSSQQQTR